MLVAILFGVFFLDRYCMICLLRIKKDISEKKMLKSFPAMDDLATVKKILVATFSEWKDTIFSFKIIK